MARWQYTKGLHDLGNHAYAYLQPDGGWGWSNAGVESLMSANRTVICLRSPSRAMR